MTTIDPPVPVHLLYMTAWLNGNGEVQFRKDIYKRDVELDRELRRRQPAYPFLTSDANTGNQHPASAAEQQ